MRSLNIRFSEGRGPERNDRPESGSSAPPSCDRESADFFLKKLEERSPGRHDLAGGGTREEEGENSPVCSFSMTGMTNPLDSLFSRRMAQEAPVAVSAGEPDMAGLEKLVERILVSTPEKGGHEVRLSLGSHVLPDTEITLSRGTDGQLAVTLSSTSASSFQTLVSAQDSLQGMLEKLEKGPVRVQVTRDSGREDNDTNRRSRGYAAEDPLSDRL